MYYRSQTRFADVGYRSFCIFKISNVYALILLYLSFHCILKGFDEGGKVNYERKGDVYKDLISLLKARSKVFAENIANQVGIMKSWKCNLYLMKTLKAVVLHKLSKCLML